MSAVRTWWHNQSRNDTWPRFRMTESCRETLIELVVPGNCSSCWFLKWIESRWPTPTQSSDIWALDFIWSGHKMDKDCFKPRKKGILCAKSCSQKRWNGHPSQQVFYKWMFSWRIYNCFPALKQCLAMKQWRGDQILGSLNPWTTLSVWHKQSPRIM